MWFGANKNAPAGNIQASLRPRKCIWGLVERHNRRFRAWLIEGENRGEWMPLFDRFVDRNSVALICSDEGRTYMNISEKFDVNHETV